MPETVNWCDRNKTHVLLAILGVLAVIALILGPIAPSLHAASAGKPVTAESRTSSVVPLPVRKPEAGYAHPGVHGPRPARIEALFPPVRFKVRSQKGRIVRTELGRRSSAELIAQAKARAAASKAMEVKDKPGPAAQAAAK